MMTSLTASSCATDMDTVVCRRSSGSKPSVHRTTWGFARNASVICKNTAVRVSPWARACDITSWVKSTSSRPCPSPDPGPSPCPCPSTDPTNRSDRTCCICSRFTPTCCTSQADREVVWVTAVSRMISLARCSERSRASSKGGSDEGSSMVTETRTNAVR